MKFFFINVKKHFNRLLLILLLFFITNIISFSLNVPLSNSYKDDNCKLKNKERMCVECEDGYFLENNVCKISCNEKNNLLSDIPTKKCISIKENPVYYDKYSFKSCENLCSNTKEDEFLNQSNIKQCSCNVSCKRNGTCCRDISQCDSLFSNIINPKNPIEDCEYYKYDNRENIICAKCKNKYLFEGICYESCDKIIKESINSYSLISGKERTTDDNKKTFIQYERNKICYDITNCQNIENCISCSNTDSNKCEKCLFGMFLLNNKCYSACPHNYHANKTNFTCEERKSISNDETANSNSFYIAMNSKSCKGICGEETISEKYCSCNYNCMKSGTCCPDYLTHCESESMNEECINCKNCDYKNKVCLECKNNSSLNQKAKNECTCDKNYRYDNANDVCITDNIDLIIPNTSSTTIKNKSDLSLLELIVVRKKKNKYDDLIKALLESNKPVWLLEHNNNVTISANNNNYIDSQNTYITHKHSIKNQEKIKPSIDKKDIVVNHQNNKNLNSNNSSSDNEITNIDLKNKTIHQEKSTLNITTNEKSNTEKPIFDNKFNHKANITNSTAQEYNINNTHTGNITNDHKSINDTKINNHNNKTNSKNNMSNIFNTTNKSNNTDSSYNFPNNIFNNNSRSENISTESNNSSKNNKTNTFNNIEEKIEIINILNNDFETIIENTISNNISSKINNFSNDIKNTSNLSKEELLDIINLSKDIINLFPSNELINKSNEGNNAHNNQNKTEESSVNKIEHNNKFDEESSENTTNKNNEVHEDEDQVIQNNTNSKKNNSSNVFINEIMNSTFNNSTDSDIKKKELFVTKYNNFTNGEYFEKHYKHFKNKNNTNINKNDKIEKNNNNKYDKNDTYKKNVNLEFFTNINMQSDVLSFNNTTNKNQHKKHLHNNSTINKTIDNISEEYYINNDNFLIKKNNIAKNYNNTNSSKIDNLNNELDISFIYKSLNFRNKHSKISAKLRKSRNFGEDDDPCDDGLCLNCNRTSKSCLECKPNSKLFDDLTYCDCIEGFYYNEKEEICSKCDWKCSSCSNEETCDACNNELGFIMKNEKCTCRDNLILSEKDKKCVDNRNIIYNKTETNTNTFENEENIHNNKSISNTTTVTEINYTDFSCSLMNNTYYDTITKECLSNNYKDQKLRFSFIIFNHGSSFSKDVDNDNEDFFNQKIEKGKEGSITDIGNAQNILLFNYIQQKYSQSKSLISQENVEAQISITSDNDDNCFSTANQFNDYIRQGFQSEIKKETIVPKKSHKTDINSIKNIPKAKNDANSINKINSYSKKRIIQIKDKMLNRRNTNLNDSTTYTYDNNRSYNNILSIIGTKGKNQSNFSQKSKTNNINEKAKDLISKYRIKSSNKVFNNPFKSIEDYSDSLVLNNSSELISKINSREKINKENISLSNISLLLLKHRSLIIVNSDFNNYLKSDMTKPFDFLLMCTSSLNKIIENQELYRIEINAFMDKLFSKLDSVLDFQTSIKYDIQAILSIIESYFSNLDLGNTHIKDLDIKDLKEFFQQFYNFIIEKIMFNSDHNKNYKSLVYKTYNYLINSLKEIVNYDKIILKKLSVEFIAFINENSKINKRNSEDLFLNKLSLNFKDIDSIITKFDLNTRLNTLYSQENQIKLNVNFLTREKFYAHMFSLQRLNELRKKKHSTVKGLETLKLDYPLNAALLQYDVYKDTSEKEIAKLLEKVYIIGSEEASNISIDDKLNVLINNHVNEDKYRIKIYNNHNLVLEEPMSVFVDDLKSKLKDADSFDLFCNREATNPRVYLLIVISIITIIQTIGLLIYCANK